MFWPLYPKSFLFQNQNELEKRDSKVDFTDIVQFVEKRAKCKCCKWRKKRIRRKCMRYVKNKSKCNCWFLIVILAKSRNFHHTRRQLFIFLFLFVFNEIITARVFWTFLWLNYTKRFDHQHVWSCLRFIIKIEDILSISKGFSFLHCVDLKLSKLPRVKNSMT